MSWMRLMAVARKEIVQLRRDARSVTLAFVLPLILIVIFGYAITMDVRNIEVALLDESRSQESEALVEAFEKSGYFSVVRRLDRPADVDGVFLRGEAKLALVIPPRFAADLGAGRPAPVQMLLDGSDANTAAIAQNYADAIVTTYARSLLPGGAGRASPPVNLHSRVWYNETLESQNMIVPGLIAVIMSIIAAMLTALTIAREWERGSMEQLAATPVHPVEVIVGKLLPYLGIGLFDVAIACLVGVVVFEVPFRGSVLLLFGMTLLFLVGALGFGIFLSAALKSQILATQAAMIATYLPALLLSGFLFSIANMPWALRVVTYAIPARYYVTVTKGVFLKGVGAETLIGPAIGLTLFAMIGVAAATRKFRKELA